MTKQATKQLWTKKQNNFRGTEGTLDWKKSFDNTPIVFVYIQSKFNSCFFLSFFLSFSRSFFHFFISFVSAIRKSNLCHTVYYLTVLFLTIVPFHIFRPSWTCRPTRPFTLINFVSISQNRLNLTLFFVDLSVLLANIISITMFAINILLHLFTCIYCIYKNSLSVAVFSFLSFLIRCRSSSSNFTNCTSSVYITCKIRILSTYFLHQISKKYNVFLYIVRVPCLPSSNHTHQTQTMLPHPSNRFVSLPSTINFSRDTLSTSPLLFSSQLHHAPL